MKTPKTIEEAEAIVEQHNKRMRAQLSVIVPLIALSLVVVIVFKVFKGDYINAVIMTLPLIPVMLCCIRIYKYYHQAK